jgi:DcuC family C4-dicarboxylate transporter
MEYLSPILAIVFIVVVARLLLKKIYPHAVLLFAGLLMMVLAMILGQPLAGVKESTGWVVFDLFVYIKESFSKTNAGVGLMIMSIGGFVAYMDKIGASNSLVHLAMKPLGLLKKYPYATAAAVIPIGQLLFVCIPSAAGLGLLLMASVFPILIGLGVSRLSAVSVITACTAFGIGPASAITARATTIAEQESIYYFIEHQLPLMLPLCLVVTISYYFVNRYYDRKAISSSSSSFAEASEDSSTSPAAGEKANAATKANNPQTRSTNPDQAKGPSLTAPLYYSIIPLLPLILLIVFSEVFDLTPFPIELNTTTAMFISLFVAMGFEFIRKRNIREVMQSLQIFWNGMGNIFKTVVTLIIAADIFSKGLIALGFIKGLVNSSQSMGLGGIGIGVVMTVMIFLASMLMGSGNASFFAFAPLIPKIATKLGVSSTSMILPMNLAASMGRTVSPVAGVLIATAEIAGVSTLQIVKRNLIPLFAALIFLLIYHFI